METERERLVDIEKEREEVERGGREEERDIKREERERQSKGEILSKRERGERTIIKRK